MNRGQPFSICSKCGLDADYSCLFGEEPKACYSCLFGRPNIAVLKDLLIHDEIVDSIEDKAMASGLVLLASILWCGPDDAEVAMLTDIPLDEVRVRGDRLRESGVWADGKVLLDYEEDKSFSFNVALILAVLCADGIIICRHGGQSADGPPIPGLQEPRSILGTI